MVSPGGTVAKEKEGKHTVRTIQGFQEVLVLPNKNKRGTLA